MIEFHTGSYKQYGNLFRWVPGESLPNKYSNISVRNNSVYSNDDSVNFDNLSTHISNSVRHKCLDIFYTNADQFFQTKEMIFVWL